MARIHQGNAFHSFVTVLNPTRWIQSVFYTESVVHFLYSDQLGIDSCDNVYMGIITKTLFRLRGSSDFLKSRILIPP